MALMARIRLALILPAWSSLSTLIPKCALRFANTTLLMAAFSPPVKATRSYCPTLMSLWAGAADPARPSLPKMELAL